EVEAGALAAGALAAKDADDANPPPPGLLAPHPTATKPATTGASQLTLDTMLFPRAAVERTACLEWKWPRAQERARAPGGAFGKRENDLSRDASSVGQLDDRLLRRLVVEDRPPELRDERGLRLLRGLLGERRVDELSDAHLHELVALERGRELLQERVREP